MRAGTNPAKLQPKVEKRFLHRVIIPVYIPHNTGYFAESLAILKVTLDALNSTLPQQTGISVVSNGCYDEVISYLEDARKNGKIDRLVLNQFNLGRTDSIMSEVNGTDEGLITIIDADVIMQRGWFEAAHQIFSCSNRVGSVSYMPDPSKVFDFTSFTLLFGVLGKRLSWQDVSFFKRWKQFILGINQDFEKYSKKVHPTKILSIRLSENCLAPVGGHHFAATYRREIFAFSPKQKSYIKAGGHASYQYFDIPVDKAGMLRLSTPKPYCIHIGNRLEARLLDLGFTGDLKNEFAPKPLKKAKYGRLGSYKMRRILVKIIKQMRFLRPKYME
jgi:hypothetical protein